MSCRCGNLRSCSVESFSKTTVKGFLGFVMFAFLTITLFSRSLYPCLVASVGMLFTMEAAARWSEGRKVPISYMVYCLVNAAVCVVLGGYTLVNADSLCASAAIPDACSKVASVVALTLAIGSAPLAFLAFATSGLSMFAVLRECNCRLLCSRRGCCATPACCRPAARKDANASPCTLHPHALMREFVHKNKLG
jgi:hypothetical protein